MALTWLKKNEKWSQELSFDVYESYKMNHIIWLIPAMSASALTKPIIPISFDSRLFWNHFTMLIFVVQITNCTFFTLCNRTLSWLIPLWPWNLLVSKMYLLKWWLGYPWFFWVTSSNQIADGARINAGSKFSDYRFNVIPKGASKILAGIQSR